MTTREDLLKRFVECAPKELVVSVRFCQTRVGNAWLTLDDDVQDARAIIRILDQLEAEERCTEIGNVLDGEFYCSVSTWDDGKFVTMKTATGPTRAWAICLAAVEAWGK